MTKTLIVDNHTKHLTELVSLFDSVDVIKKEHFTQTSAHGYDLVVFSGGSQVPTVLRHPDMYIEEELFLKSSTIPVVGICLGAEIITHTYGGVLEELSQKDIGKKRIFVIDSSLQQMCGNEIVVNEAHVIAITALPTNFVACAQSNQGFEIMRHTEKPIFAIQFYPEITHNTQVVKWVLDRCFAK